MPSTESRTRIAAEVWIVLGLSLGQSAVYAAVSLLDKLTQGPLNEQTATLNASQSVREYFDLAYQLLGIGFALVPVALAVYLLSANGRSAVELLGLDRRDPWFEVTRGVALAALIGIPGLALYFGGRAMGITATIVPSALNEYWWTVPVLVLSAVQNAVLEEIVVVGYLVTRLKDLTWSLPAVLATSALVRGSYHLYQGVGPALGNAVMGVVFGYFYHRTGRVLPLVIAHALLDIVSFVGYALLKDPLGLP